MDPSCPWKERPRLVMLTGAVVATARHLLLPSMHEALVLLRNISASVGSLKAALS